MYINPFWAGVAATVLVELVVFFVWLVLASSKGEW